MAPPVPEPQRTPAPKATEHAELLPWAAAVLVVERLDARVVATRTTSEVLTLTTSTGSPPAAYLKLYRRGRGFRQERAALRDWGPSTGRVARVLAEHPGPPPALLLRPLPGQPAHGLASTDRRWPGIHQAAGRWLRRLHDLPFTDQDALPLARALQARASSWCRRAEGLVPAPIIAWLGERLEALDLRQATRVPCHADFGPRNWLWCDAAGFSVVDFEHARADLWAFDLHVLAAEPWQGRPDLEAAFWDGYGRVPDEQDAALIGAATALYALGTIVWARSQADAESEAQGWRVLARAGAPVAASAPRR